MKYDYIIVGSGFFGSVCAYELKKIGKNVLVIESRSHIGGNCYTENRDNINVHIYGPHIFHTSNKLVWEWIQQFTEFNDFVLRPVANYNGDIYSLPFNMWTFSKLWNIWSPEEAKKIIKEQSQSVVDEPKNLEEQSIKLVGCDIYEKLIKGYTEKQWGKPCNELPIEIIKRLPVRFTYDNNYYNDIYQGIPIGGYTQIFEKLLDGIEIILGVDYLKEKSYWDSITEKVIYTGHVDRYYDYCFGELEYKTLRFEHKYINVDYYQGTAMMNFTHKDIPYTRSVEHKMFENVNCSGTWVTWEYPDKYITDKTYPLYPVNDNENNMKYLKYKNIPSDEKIFFGGRLAEYKYYNMDDVIESALNFVKNIR